uniref:30S ribosomal protein S2, chloroplastic n=1 Tax=Aegilops tauschii subsp. strangulata TaxID=200361 RepID=A0A453PZ01_AEGTS
MHTPGTFTNQMQSSFSEPRLLILTDPRTDHQPIKESALGNIPTIAFCDTDSPMRYIDIGILVNGAAAWDIASEHLFSGFDAQFQSVQSD